MTSTILSCVPEEDCTYAYESPEVGANGVFGSETRQSLWVFVVFALFDLEWESLHRRALRPRRCSVFKRYSEY